MANLTILKKKTSIVVKSYRVIEAPAGTLSIDGETVGVGEQGHVDRPGQLLAPQSLDRILDATNWI